VSAVRRKLSIACLLVAWLCANGAVWNVLQMVAWARMFHTNTQIMPATAALERTFDGSKPCELCHIAQKAQDAAQHQLPRDAALGGGMEKLLLLSESVPSLVIEVPDSTWPSVADGTGMTRPELVPVPPPRA
jgi:hypothetical protein